MPDIGTIAAAAPRAPSCLCRQSPHWIHRDCKWRGVHSDLGKIHLLTELLRTQILTLQRTTSKSSSFPCKSPHTVTCCETVVDTIDRFGICLRALAASRRMSATYLGCKRFPYTNSVKHVFNELQNWVKKINLPSFFGICQLGDLCDFLLLVSLFWLLQYRHLPQLEHHFPPKQKLIIIIR